MLADGLKRFIWITNQNVGHFITEIISPIFFKKIKFFSEVSVVNIMLLSYISLYSSIFKLQKRSITISSNTRVYGVCNDTCSNRKQFNHKII